MPAVPRAGLVVVEAELVLRRLEPVLDGPALAFDRGQRPDRGPGRAPGGEVGILAIGGIASDQQTACPDAGRAGPWTRGLLVRRSLADGELAFSSTWCPAGTGIATLVEVEGHRWAIEDGFETAKNELGLDHNETRSWHGWHRHVSLVMLAFAMLAAIRRRANEGPPPKTTARA